MRAGSAGHARQTPWENLCGCAVVVVVQQQQEKEKWLQVSPPSGILDCQTSPRCHARAVIGRLATETLKH